jgi:putative transposase
MISITSADFLRAVQRLISSSISMLIGVSFHKITPEQKFTGSLQLGRVPTSFLLRSDNGLVFTSRHYTRLVRSYGLRQEFITPHCPQQNGMVERLIRTLKEQCVHRHRFESQQHAMRIIGDWIQFYNHRRPHQALGMRTPAEAYALAA